MKIDDEYKKYGSSITDKDPITQSLGHSIQYCHKDSPAHCATYVCASISVLNKYAKTPGISKGSVQ